MHDLNCELRTGRHFQDYHKKFLSLLALLNFSAAEGQSIGKACDLVAISSGRDRGRLASIPLRRCDFA